MISMENKPMVGIVGAGTASPDVAAEAEEIGRLVAKEGWIMVCGGLGGVMEAAARGATEAGGLTVGILPGSDRRQASPWIVVPVATGFGEGRNVFIVRTSDVIIAVGGEYGTLSEIALALKAKKPVISLGSWDIPGTVPVQSPEEAVVKAKALLGTVSSLEPVA